MNYLQNIFDESLVNAIGWTILHSLWQGAIVVIIAALVLSIFKNPSSKLRYNVYASALFALLGSSLLTFCYLQHNNNSSTVDWVVPVEVQNENNDIVELVFLDENVASKTQEAETSVSAFFADLSATANDYMGLIVVLWFLGCLLFSIRFVGGFVYIQRLRKRNTYPVEAHWQKKLQFICDKMGLNKTIRLLESASVSGPMVIGHFKPIILFPIGALTGMNPSQVEAILAHELAHIYRNDYLVNILQSLAEIVLFYHPAAWWLSNKMQATREHCCDDLAISLCGDRIVYAKALTKIESLKLQQQQSPYLAAAFAGNGKEDSLMARIQRLFSPVEKQFNFIDGWVASMMLVIALLAFSWTSHSNIEAAEKEVNIFIDSVMEDLKWVAEDMGDAFVELTSDSTKRAKKDFKKIQKIRLKTGKKAEKNAKKAQKKVQKLIFKNKDGYVVVSPTPPLPPVINLSELPNSNVLVLPEMPNIPLPLLYNIPDLPEPPEAPDFSHFNGICDLSTLIAESPDIAAMIANQPDIQAIIAEQPDIRAIISSDHPNIFYMDSEGGDSQKIIIESLKGKKPIIIKDKIKDKIKNKIKYKIKPFKNVIKLNIPMGLDSVKRQEFKAKLQPLKDILADRQQKLKESMGKLNDMEEEEVERIIRDYEEALENYEEELEEWQEKLEDEHEHGYHFEWNEEDRLAFEEKMEKWGEEWGQKWGKQWGDKWNEEWAEKWDEEKMEEWAEKWEQWADKWEEWGEQWGQKWSEEWEQEYEQKMREWEKKYEDQMKEYEYHWEEYENEMQKHEEELNIFEDAYESAMEEGEHVWELNLKEMTSNLRGMLEDDGLINEDTRKVKVKYNRRTAKVNGSEIPKDKMDKYRDFFKDHMGNDASFTLDFTDKNSNISLSGKNMEIHR